MAHSPHRLHAVKKPFSGTCGPKQRRQQEPQCTDLVERPVTDPIHGARSTEAKALVDLEAICDKAAALEQDRDVLSGQVRGGVLRLLRQTPGAFFLSRVYPC